jgi:hypothetical protein
MCFINDRKERKFSSHHPIPHDLVIIIIIIIIIIIVPPAAKPSSLPSLSS